MKKAYTAPTLNVETFQLDSVVAVSSLWGTPKNNGWVNNQNCWGYKSERWEVNADNDFCDGLPF